MSWGLHLGNNLAVLLVFSDPTVAVTRVITNPTINYACLLVYLVGWVLVGISSEVKHAEDLGDGRCDCPGSRDGLQPVLIQDTKSGGI